VIANVLVSEAANALGDDSERLPEVGPSFRDTTRVAGANPSIWIDIFASNREALAGEIEAVVERLGRAVELLREDDVEGLAVWHREALADRRRLVEAELVGGALSELRVSVTNEPGTVAEIALALGRAGVNIEDMALYPAADMRTGAISLWVAGEREAERAAEIVRGLGYTVSAVSGEE
jgi:prephenate dehydrogenase